MSLILIEAINELKVELALVRKELLELRNAPGRVLPFELTADLEE